MQHDDSKITPPWTRRQVDALNAWQAAGYVHPFTCGNDDHPEHVSLVATRQGWVCPECDYTQQWAHRFMLELPGNPFAHLQPQGDTKQ